MTRDEMIATLQAIDQRLDNRVQIVRVIIAPDGSIVKRIPSGSFVAAAEYEPPTLEQTLERARGGNGR